MATTAGTEQSDMFNAFMADDVKLEKCFEFSAGHELAAMEISPDGRYLATSSVWGRTSIRDTFANGKAIEVLNSGKGTRVSALRWCSGSAAGRALLIASCNGYINCIEYPERNITDSREPSNTGVWVPGYVTSMAANASETHLAVAHDYTVRTFNFPFAEGDPRDGTPCKQGRLICMSLFEGGRAPESTPVRDQLWPVKVDWLSETVLCVAFFSCIKAFDISGDVVAELWTIRVPASTDIGSFSISPSKQLIAVTSLKGTVDWYNLTSRARISSTEIQPYGEMSSSFILPIAFLDEKTFICGHNDGYLVLGGHGVDFVHKVGEKTHHPTQLVCMANSSGLCTIVFAPTFKAGAAIIGMTIVPSTEVETESSLSASVLQTRLPYVEPLPQPPVATFQPFQLGTIPAIPRQAPQPQPPQATSEGERFLQLVLQALWEITVGWIKALLASTVGRFKALLTSFGVVFMLFTVFVGLLAIFSFLTQDNTITQTSPLAHLTPTVELSVVEINPATTQTISEPEPIPDPLPSSALSPILTTTTVVPSLEDRADTIDHAGLSIDKENLTLALHGLDGIEDNFLEEMEELIDDKELFDDEELADDEELINEEMVDGQFNGWDHDSVRETQVIQVTKTITATITSTVTTTVTATVTHYRPRRMRGTKQVASKTAS